MNRVFEYRMSNLLVGNGIIIQYGGTDYLNSDIVERAIDNIRSGRFPAHLYPKECADFVVALQKEHSSALKGNYDKYVFTSYDRSSLRDFKNRYVKTDSYSVNEIGFEDYFLLFELVHNKQRIENPERFNSRGVLRRMFLDAVFNIGKIETIYKKFPYDLITWLKGHDHIFTTNYDSNLDIATGFKIHHLHGSFQTLSENYDPNSFRNQLKDDLLDGEKMDPKFPHLYSNCLISYVGELKEYSMKESSLANNGMEKFVSGYKNDPKIRQQIEALPDSNDLTRRLKEAIKLKAEHPELEHAEQYPHHMLENISGSLEIVGLSPNNDGHLFAEILKNNKISEIIFYHFGKQEAVDAQRIFTSKKLITREVQNLWSKLEN